MVMIHNYWCRGYWIVDQLIEVITVCRTASRNLIFSATRINKTIYVLQQPFFRVSDHSNDVKHLDVDDDNQDLIDNSDLLIFDQDVIQVWVFCLHLVNM